MFSDSLLLLWENTVGKQADMLGDTYKSPDEICCQLVLRQHWQRSMHILNQLSRWILRKLDTRSRKGGVKDDFKALAGATQGRKMVGGVVGVHTGRQTRSLVLLILSLRHFLDLKSELFRRQLEI